MSELHLWRRDLNCDRYVSALHDRGGVLKVAQWGEGFEKWGERTSPTLPRTVPVGDKGLNLLRNQSVTKVNGRWTRRVIREPRKFSLKDLKKCSLWTPSRIMPIRSTQTRGYEFPRLWNIEDCGNKVDAKIQEWGDPQPHHEKNGAQRRGRFPGLYHKKEYM